MTASTVDRRAPLGAAPAPSPLGLVLRGARKVAEALATPLVPDDYLDLFDPLRAGADLRGRIVEIRPETVDAATIVIRPGRDWAGHLPGQYIRIGVDIRGVRHWRAYSLTHRANTAEGTISITTKAIPDGLASGFLVRDARPGTVVHLDQATGDFTLPTPAPRRILFLTAGSGITPIVGMLRNHLPELGEVAHVHCAPRREDVIFRRELESYAASGRLALSLRLDDEHGVLDLSRDLDTLVPDWREREVWVCGPSGLLDAAEQGGTTILDAGEEAGVLMPSGCRMGICFGCVVTMRQGAVRDLRTGDITTAEPGEEVAIQTCINAVAGSCDLEL